MPDLPGATAAREDLPRLREHVLPRGRRTRGRGVLLGEMRDESPRAPLPRTASRKGSQRTEKWFLTCKNG